MASSSGPSHIHRHPPQPEEEAEPLLLNDNGNDDYRRRHHHSTANAADAGPASSSALTDPNDLDDDDDDDVDLSTHPRDKLAFSPVARWTVLHVHAAALLCAPPFILFAIQAVVCQPFDAPRGLGPWLAALSLYAFPVALVAAVVAAWRVQRDASGWAAWRVAAWVAAPWWALLMYVATAKVAGRPERC